MNYDQQVMMALGLNTPKGVAAFSAAKGERTALMMGDPMVNDVHNLVVRNRLQKQNLARHAAIDNAHGILKGIAKETGVAYPHLLSALSDKFLAENNNGDDDDADEGDGDIENSPDDAGDMRSVQDMKPSPAPRPSPVDRTPDTGSPRYLANHAQAHRSTGGLLLNVSKQGHQRS